MLSVEREDELGATSSAALEVVNLASSERRAALGPVERSEAGQAKLANPLFLRVHPVASGSRN